MLDLSCADDCLSWLMSAFSEGRNIGNVPGIWSASTLCFQMYDLHSEDIDIWVLDFFEAVEAREECTPEKKVSFPNWLPWSIETYQNM